MDDDMVAVNCAQCQREVKGRPGRLRVYRIKGRPYCRACVVVDPCLDPNYGRTPAQALKMSIMLRER